MRIILIKTVFFLSLVLSGMQCFAQNDSAGVRYREAYEFERSADYESAEIIYRSLYESQPENYNYFTRYKFVLTRQRKLDLLLPLLEAAVNRRSYDTHLRIELGVLYYARNNRNAALTQWRLVFRGKNSGVVKNYAVHVYQSLSNLGLGDLLAPIAEELRSITGIPDLLARYVFINKVNYRDWQQALAELRLLISGDASEFRQAKTLLFNLDTSLHIFDLIPEAVAGMEGTECRIFLSDLYIYLGMPDSAVGVLTRDTSDMILQEAMRGLAQRLHRSGEFSAAARAAAHAAKYAAKPDIREAMLLLFARSRIDAFLAQKERLSRIPPPYPSVLSEIPFPSFRNADTGLIEEAMATLAELEGARNPAGLEAAYYKAELLFTILQDVDSALSVFLKLAGNPPPDKRIRILARTADCYQARGEFEKAKDFLENAARNYRLMADEEDQLTPYLLRARFLADGPDSLYEKSLNILALLPEDHVLYNDVAAYAACISQAAKDSSNARAWLEAERLLVRNKINEAAEEYRGLLSPGGQLPALYAMRYIDCLSLLDRKAEEGVFWEKYYEDLKSGVSGDYFTLRHAEYQEKMKNHKKAVEIYEKFLLSYRESMYYEMIRQYMREINTPGEP